jgi:ribosome maturation factor RimP
MLKEEDIRCSLGTILADSGLFLVDLNVRKDNYIRVLIDKQDGVSIEDCSRVSRLLDARLNRDIEDFELEVSSPGLDAPLKVFRQYQKNLGKEVEVIKKDGMKVNGRLIRIDDDGLLLEVTQKTKKGDRKNKANKSEYFLFSDIKSTKVKINF